MDSQRFQSQMNRLAETFGAHAYKRERVELIWREVKELSDNWFSSLVDRLIGECRQAPLMPEFRDAISLERGKQWERKKAESLRQVEEKTFNPRCRMCSDTGAIRAVLKENPIGFYVFKCLCEAGRADQRKYQPWDGSDRYEVYA